MIRKYYNHTPQTDPRQRDEAPYTRKTNKVKLPHQYYCKKRKETKQRTTKYGTHNGSNTQQRKKQQQNRRLRTDCSLGH